MHCREKEKKKELLSSIDYNRWRNRNRPSLLEEAIVVNNYGDDCCRKLSFLCYDTRQT